ncbi:MAG: thioredoxin family protein [bacterium]
MSKFGEIIDVEIPVLLEFFTEWNEESKNMQATLHDVAASLGDKVKVVKIDVEKNKELADALRIKALPTLIIYKNGDMKWRQSGSLDADTIINQVQEYA